MRTIKLDMDVADENLTGFASNVTGAAFVITTNATSDGLAHQVSIRNDAAVDHSGKTITLVGTDADDRPQTEVVTGPGVSATVESTKYFKTLTSATPSATIGADTFDIGWVDEVASRTIPLNHYSSRAPAVQIMVTGTLNVDVEGTLSEIRDDGSAPFDFADQNAAEWLNDANFTAKTASLVDDLALAGYRAIRIVYNSYSSGAELQAFITQSPY